MPVVPATQEAEAGESLEPMRQRLQWADRITALQRGRQSEILSQKKKIFVTMIMGCVIVQSTTDHMYDGCPIRL